jgi:hypothetical protein
MIIDTKNTDSATTSIKTEVFNFLGKGLIVMTEQNYSWYSKYKKMVCLKRKKCDKIIGLIN